MDINKKIEEYLNQKISSNKTKISKEVSKILGINDKYILNKLNHFFPLYIFTKSSLKLSLNMDMEILPIEDIRLINYLLDLLEDNDKLYLNNTKTLKNSNKKFIISINPKLKELDYYFEHNIYQGSKSSDLDFINNLLFFLSINNSYKFNTSNVNIPKSDYIYLLFLNNLSIMITSNLHKNNIYLFDNKYISQTPSCMETSIEDYFKLFYNLFKELIPVFITDYKSFINYLGINNFKEFINKITKEDIENIDKVIQTMYKHSIECQNEILIDVDTIFDSIKKYKKKQEN